jgi:hypothetical protein
MGVIAMAGAGDTGEKATRPTQQPNKKSNPSSGEKRVVVSFYLSDTMTLFLHHHKRFR